jgi:hypothetical protein
MRLTHDRKSLPTRSPCRRGRGESPGFEAERLGPLEVDHKIETGGKEVGMAMAFGLRYAPSQPAGPQDSASAEAHCLQAFKAENTPAAFLESIHASRASS